MPAKNSCSCPNPPGGRAECELHQLAICRVRNGIAQTSCIDPPFGLIGLAYTNWALSEVTGRPRRFEQELTEQEKSILSEGRYFDPQTETVVSFRLGVPIEHISQDVLYERAVRSGQDVARSIRFLALGVIALLIVVLSFKEPSFLSLRQSQWLIVVSITMAIAVVSGVWQAWADARFSYSWARELNCEEPGRRFWRAKHAYWRQHMRVASQVALVSFVFGVFAITVYLILQILANTVVTTPVSR